MVGSNQSETYTFALEKGPVYTIYFSQPPALPIGCSGPIEVITVMPTPLPFATVTSHDVIARLS